MLEAIENEEIPHKDDALGCFDPDQSQRDRSSSEYGGEDVAEEISDSDLKLQEEVDARKQEPVCSVKKDDDLSENKLPSTSIVGNDAENTEVTDCAFRENSEIATQCSNSSEHITSLEDSTPTRENAPIFKDSHKEIDDTTSSTATRCRVYERATKKLSCNFRGFSESSLSVRGINNLLVPYRCGEVCDFTSVSLSALKIHYMLKHAGEDLFLCTLCSERFVCDDSLLEHICKYHYDQHKIIFECKVNDCSMPFPRLENLREHLYAGHKDCKLIPCSFCFCESCSTEDMMKHIRSHLKRTLRCAYCLLIFNSREEVIKHINASHAGFLRKLNLHVEVINHERRLKKKNFRNECLSAKHNIANIAPCCDGLIISPLTKPLPYQCRDCTYTCINDNLLNIHIKEGHLEHVDITKDFSCNFCKFSTNDKDTIINHLSFHTNARFLRCYSCPYCPKESNCIDIIESHLLEQHPLASFKFEAGQENIGYLQDMVLCPLCKGTFKWKSRFCNHLSTKHNLKALAEYLMLQCNSDVSKNSLILPKQFLTDKLEITLPVTLSSMSDDNQSNKVTSEEYVFKCIKCNFKNSNYNVYNEHVKSHYEAFDAEENPSAVPTLKKENSMLFVCKLCPFQCNKSLNFKRHSAIHERAKSLENCFKCGYCMFKHDRINCIKFHLGKYHERLPIKVVKITNCEEIDITESEFVKNNNLNHFEKVENSSKKEGNRVANEYFDSFLPRGMIFAEPVKCPNCNYANRVRINLIRHMRQHLYEDLVQTPKDKSTSQEASGKDGDGSSDSPPRCEYQRSVSEETFLSGDSPVQSFSGDGVTTKKLFKCAYCDVVSKWNRRDISLHILHVHLQKKVYTCSYCDYGSRKSSQMVMNHCSKVHPGKPIIIKDELALFNSVVPLRDGDGVITVAYVKKNGAPILSLEELGSYLKLNVKKNKNDMTLAGNLDKDDEIVPSVDKITANEGFSQDVDEEIYPDNVDNSKEWKCMFCGLQMFSEVMMKRHVMCQHMKLKPYSCKYCKAQYWQKQSMENHMRCNHPDEDMCYVENAKEKMSLVNKYMQKLTNVHRIRQTPSKKYSSIYHCRICGYQDPRHDKAKYHVVKKHLKIGLYSCSKCHQYMGGKGCVENHIEEFHPGSDAYVCRSYDIHALFLQKNIRKISGFQSNKNSTQRNSLSAGRKSSLRIKSEMETSTKLSQSKALLTCNHCSYVAESEASLGAHSRVHKVFACFYCDYQNNLVSRVQSHCLIRHPTKPIKHKQIAPITARIQTEDLNRFTESPRTYELDKADQEKDDSPNISPPLDFSPERSSHSKPGLEYLYKCKLCSYNSDKATVIRHHIMSHLLYHPYQCPYCNLVCSVKSSPITKHIQLKHPDKEIRFICKRDEQMEKQVRNSFEKVSLDPDGNITGIETASQVSPIIKDEQHFAANQRIYYKCCFCSLVTPIRTDMKHHLMRELKYKPFSCAYCQYEEPCKSKMGKHFRIKHPGMTISIKHSVNAKKELQIFDYLQKCMVRNDSKKVDKAPEKTGNIPIIRISNLQNVLISSLHYRGKLHKCSKCQYETSSIKALISHRSVHDKFRLKCCFCCFANKNLFLLRRHMKKCYVRNCLLPANPKKVKSEWFKSLKRRVSKFVRNMRPVLKARCLKKLVCCFCNQGFPSIHLLQSHLKNSHFNTAKYKSTYSIRRAKNVESPTTFCCDQCPLKFSALEDFGIHLQIHYAKKVTFPLLEVFPDEVDSKHHQCGFCSFQTTQDEEFTAHVTTHTTLHPIKCKHCLFASFTSSDMKQHFEVNHPNQDVRFDSLTQPYTMMAQSSQILPNFKPIVKLVDLKFCLS